MSKQTFRLLLKSSYRESEKVPDFVNRIQAEAGLNEDEAGRLMLVLSEAVTNAIVHGNQEDTSKQVETHVTIKSGEIETVVKDQGEGFDPDSTDDPLKEENLTKEGGRGIFLIRQMCDDVEFLDGGTVIRFVLYRD